MTCANVLVPCGLTVGKGSSLLLGFSSSPLSFPVADPTLITYNIMLVIGHNVNLKAHT